MKQNTPEAVGIIKPVNNHTSIIIGKIIGFLPVFSQSNLPTESLIVFFIVGQSLIFFCNKVSRTKDTFSFASSSNSSDSLHRRTPGNDIRAGYYSFSLRIDNHDDNKNTIPGQYLPIP